MSLIQQPLSSLLHICFLVDMFYDRNSRNTQEKGYPLGGSSEIPHVGRVDVQTLTLCARKGAHLFWGMGPAQDHGEESRPASYEGAWSSGACAVARKWSRVKRCWSKQLGRRDGALRSPAWACPRRTGGSTQRREDQDMVCNPGLSQGAPAPSQMPTPPSSFPVPSSLHPRRSASVPTQTSMGPNVWWIFHPGKLLAGCPFPTPLEEKLQWRLGINCLEKTAMNWSIALPPTLALTASFFTLSWLLGAHFILQQSPCPPTFHCPRPSLPCPPALCLALPYRLLLPPRPVAEC